MKKLRMTELKRRIKQGTEKIRFLGLVENRELTPEVESLFYCKGYNGTSGGYDWVNGNKKLKQLIRRIEKNEKSRMGNAQ